MIELVLVVQVSDDEDNTPFVRVSTTASNAATAAVAPATSTNRRQLTYTNYKNKTKWQAKWKGSGNSLGADERRVPSTFCIAYVLGFLRAKIYRHAPSANRSCSPSAERFPFPVYDIVGSIGETHSTDQTWEYIGCADCNATLHDCNVTLQALKKSLFVAPASRLVHASPRPLLPSPSSFHPHQPTTKPLRPLLANVFEVFRDTTSVSLPLSQTLYRSHFAIVFAERCSEHCPYTSRDGTKGRVCDSSCESGDPYGTKGCNARQGRFGLDCRVCYYDVVRAMKNDSGDDRAIM